MATITPATGSVRTHAYTAASAGGDIAAFGSASRPSLIVRNASAGSITVTLGGTVTCSLGFTHNYAVPCPVGDTEIAVPSYVVDPTPATRGNVSISYSSATSVSVAAISS